MSLEMKYSLLLQPKAQKISLTLMQRSHQRKIVRASRCDIGLWASSSNQRNPRSSPVGQLEKLSL